MPYIDRTKRQELFDHPNAVSTAGELNYFITRACINFLNRSDMKYADYNTIIGALECAKQEFYRRAVVPYEDRKIILNGDCY